MLQVADRMFADIKGLAIDETLANGHVMRPANTVGVQGLTDQEAPAMLATGRPVRAKAPAVRFDHDAFAAAMDQALETNMTGYYWELRQSGTRVVTGSNMYARRPVDDAAPWNAERVMHVGSCSKLITAMAMTRVMAEHGISLDQPIAPYLPTYWIKGINVNAITFRELMTHTGGFMTGTSQSDFGFMKLEVAVGAPNRGTYQYENMNFGLCRILLAVINGNIARTMVFPINNDLYWDYITIAAYEQYCQSKVFQPASVADASLKHGPLGALAYNWPVGSGHGWDSGDLSTMSGGAGWHLSAHSLIRLLGAFRRGGSIVGEAQAQAMLDAGVGVDGVRKSALGNYYMKNGKWQQGEGFAQQTEQALAYFLPGDMELVALANSRYGILDSSFAGVVNQIYADAIKPI